MIDKDGRIITQIARVGVAVSMIVVLASLDTSHVVGLRDRAVQSRA